jgi:hypothetical protein
MANFIEKLNLIVKNHAENFFKEKNINKSREKIINESLEFLLLYTNINLTKVLCRNKVNVANKVYHSRSTYERNIKFIDINFFKELHNKILKFYYDESPKYQHIIDILNNLECSAFSDIRIKPIDGTCSNIINNGKLYTNLDVYSLDSIHGIPLEIMDNTKVKIFDNNKNNKSNKNGETTILNNFIDNLKNTEDKDKDIYIGDRLYSSYNVINKLQSKNCKFIIRLKDNLDILKENIKDKYKQNLKNNSKNNIINDTNIRIIKYSALSTDMIKSKSMNKELKFKINKNYNLITNLDEKIYNNDVIATIYKFRWNIEIFFKYLKNNFKFDNFNIKDSVEIEKLKYAEMIIFTLNKLILLYCLNIKYNNDKNKFNPMVKIRKSAIENKDMRYRKNKEKYNNFQLNNYERCSIRVNLNLSLDGFYNIILNKIIRGNLDDADINTYEKNYVDIQKNKLNRNFCRTSISPFSKWYIKSYSRLNEYKKITKAIDENNVDHLNKNLKLKAKDILSDNNIAILKKIKELLQ